MMRYSRSTNRYGPGGKAGFSSGMAKALASTSSSVMATSCCCLPSVSFAPILGEVEGGEAGELVVLGVPFVMLRAVDQVHHGEQLVVGQERQLPGFRAVAQVRR